MTRSFRFTLAALGVAAVLLLAQPFTVAKAERNLEGLRADTSAAVVFLKNGTPIDLKLVARVLGGPYTRIGICPARSICLFVFGSEVLGTSPQFWAVVFGTDSLAPLLEQRSERHPGVVNLLLMQAQPAPSALKEL